MTCIQTREDLIDGVRGFDPFGELLCLSQACWAAGQGSEVHPALLSAPQVGRRRQCWQHLQVASKVQSLRQSERAGNKFSQAFKTSALACNSCAAWQIKVVSAIKHKYVAI